MEFLKDFISECGTTIIKFLLTALATYLGVVAKNLYQKYLNDKTKREVASVCVKAVEQMYKDLHGKEKLEKALESASVMLSQKGITVSDSEMKTLIEAALAEFNKAFDRTETTEMGDGA